MCRHVHLVGPPIREPTSLFFFLSSCRAHRHLPSFPTRRSSDLVLSDFGGQAEVGNLDGDSFIRSTDGCPLADLVVGHPEVDRKSTRLNSSHRTISYAVFCLKKKKKTQDQKLSNTS